MATSGNLRRQGREHAALRYLVEHRRVSALALGTAAVAHEPPAKRSVRASIGLALGVHFVAKGFARVTRWNQFEWMPKE